MSTDRESRNDKTASEMQISQFNLQQSDEVDLMALFAVLIRNKFIIIAITVAITLISTLVVSLLPQKWSSTAVVVPPSSEEIKDINTLSAQLSVLDVKIDLSAQQIFNAFIEQYRSKVNQEAYVRSTNYFQELAKKIDPADKENGEQRLVNNIITNSIHITDQSKEKIVHRMTLYSLSLHRRLQKLKICWLAMFAIQQQKSGSNLSKIFKMR
ncbi:Wzz/FepE/Etk N-terminal domain-containing protein [Providencia vermicola]